jgi:hypothetical protein
MPVIINVGGSAMMKGVGACPHLKFKGNEATCVVHQESWYKGSPCDTYGNSDLDPDFELKRGRPCPVGKLIQADGGLPKNQREPFPLEELEHLGPWPVKTADESG